MKKPKKIKFIGCAETIAKYGDEGKSFLYINYCRTCQHRLTKCPHL